MSRIFGIKFAPLNMKEILAVIVGDKIPQGENVRLLVTANLDHIVTLEKNLAFRRAYEDAWLVTADGMPVYLYAKFRGANIPERVTGADLFAMLMERLDPYLHRPFFVASSNEAGRYLLDWLVVRGFSSDVIGLDVPPFGFENDSTYSEDLARRIRSHNTTHLVFGVGAPKSEIWIHEHRASLGPCFAFGFGAGLDFFSGLQPRAPIWMRQIGAEWFWRLIHEPRRLFRRYIVNSWGFLSAIRNDLSTMNNHVSEMDAERKR